MSDIRPKPSSGPELRVAAPALYEEGRQGKLGHADEWMKLVKGPGQGLNLSSGMRFDKARGSLESQYEPYLGVHYEKKGTTPVVQDVPNPDAPDGKWNPLEFMPRFVFEGREDAFPIDPTFDGDTNLANNGPATPDGKDGNFKHGVIGGNQGLSAGFAVTKKGDYTVLTYSFYHATNKAFTYHSSDYSTAQVFLKPDADGKLAPSHVYTSWHHGGQLTKWSDMAKDAQGRPVISVLAGSHAMQPLGRGDDIPTEGLSIRGDGVAELDGQALPHQMSFQAFQKNVAGAEYLDPLAATSRPRLETMRWGYAALNPLLPEVFTEHGGTWSQAFDGMVKRPLKSAAGWVEAKVEDHVLAPAKKVGGWAGEQLKRLPFIG